MGNQESLGLTKPECLDRLSIWCRYSFFLVHHGKPTGVVPHGPAYPMLFQHRAHVRDPGGAIRRSNKPAKSTKLVASQRNMILFRPLRDHADLRIQTRCIPSVLTIAQQVVAR